jgi:hypothetical protein
VRAHEAGHSRDACLGATHGRRRLHVAGVNVGQVPVGFASCSVAVAAAGLAPSRHMRPRAVLPASRCTKVDDDGKLRQAGQGRSMLFDLENRISRLARRRTQLVAHSCQSLL